MRSIQPGIESLSTAVLRLMKKGTTGIQNVNLLRWARYYGLHTSWNLLYGFPGEISAYYDEQNALIPALRHLQPPMGLSRIWIERFSPVFKQHEGVPNLLRPEPSYSYVYPHSVDLSKAAYFFVGNLENTVADFEVDEFSNSVQLWMEAWTGAEKPSFIFSVFGASVVLLDRRQSDSGVETVLTGLAAAIVKAASETPLSYDRLAPQLSSEGDAVHVNDVLNDLGRSGVIMREGDLLLSLPLPAQ